MKKHLASMLGLAALIMFVSGLPVTARADNNISISLGRACGADRYGHPLHLQYSQNEDQCVYLSNDSSSTHCTQESCCPTKDSPANMTQKWDAKNSVCKQIAGTDHVHCGTGTALYYVNAAPASSVSGVAAAAVATDNPNGQVCLQAGGPFAGTSSYVGPCGIPDTTALYTKLNPEGTSEGLTLTPSAAKIPGYGSGNINGLGTFTCVSASKPTLTDVPDGG